MRNQLVKTFFVLSAFILFIADKAVATDFSDDALAIRCFIYPEGDYAPLFDKPNGNAVADIYPGHEESLAVEIVVKSTGSNFWQIISYYDYDIDDDKQSTQYIGLFAPRYILALSTRLPTTLYSKPTTQAEIICSLAQHEIVRPMEIQGEWLKVSLMSVADEQGCHKVAVGYITGWIRIDDLCGSAWTNCC